MRHFRFLMALSTFFAASSCNAAPIEVDAREALEHQTFEHIWVYGVPAERAEPFGTLLNLTINEEGRVSTACVVSYRDDGYCRSLDARFLQDIRYRPFLRNGAAVPVAIYADATLYPEERRLKRSIPFPTTDLAPLHIRLSRSACFGTCPSYDVSIDGAGNVVWYGNLYTVLDGERRARLRGQSLT